MEIWEATPNQGPTAPLVDLVYELLDAHQDTMRLAQDRLTDLRWAAHIDYLRRLQRVGREALAGTDPLSAAAPTAPAPGSASRHRRG